MQELTFQAILEDFTKVVQFQIIETIRRHWGSLNEFKAEWIYQETHKDKEANRIFAFIQTSFHVEKATIRSLTQDHNGKRYAKEIKAALDPNELVYAGKKTLNYKSGKKFNCDSWFYIPFKRLDELFAFCQIDADPFDVKSKYYTERQRKLIFKYILKKRTPNKKILSEVSEVSSLSANIL